MEGYIVVANTPMDNVPLSVWPMLAEAESALADITAQLENKSASDQALLDTLVSLAAQVERATAENIYRFSATRAYSALVGERIRRVLSGFLLRV